MAEAMPHYTSSQIEERMANIWAMGYPARAEWLREHIWRYKVFTSGVSYLEPNAFWFCPACKVKREPFEFVTTMLDHRDSEEHKHNYLLSKLAQEDNYGNPRK